VAIENRPGYPTLIQLGGNFAQPACSPGAVPEGQTLIRSLEWAGDRNSGAPLFDNDLRDVSEYRKLFGDTAIDDLASTPGGLSPGVLDTLKRTSESAQGRAIDSRNYAARMLSYLGAVTEQFG
jgi:hypothetical protein